MDAKKLYPLFRKYNQMKGYRVQYESPKRLALIEKCLEVVSLEELEKAVLDGDWIDDTLKNIIAQGGAGTEPTEPVIEEPTEQKSESEIENTEIKEEVKPMDQKSLGSELEKILMGTIAMYSADKVVETVMPMIQKKIIEEFGMIPVKHEIKVAEKTPMQMTGELPPVFDEILANSANGNSVMMTGPAGTGKGYMARQVAKALGAEFYEVNAVTNEYQLTGFVDANSRFVRTPFYDACKAVAEGRKAVFLFDEMDCSNAESLKVFNDALEAREFTFPNDEKLQFEDLIILSACNTFGTGADDMYVGEKIDASTLNRFVLIKVDYNRKIEMALAGGDEELVDFIDAFRNQVEKNGMAFVVSYRNIKQITNIKHALPLKSVMKTCLVKSMGEDDLRNVLSNISDIMGDNIYYRACKGENVKVA